MSELSQAPTDDEREALSRLLNETDPEGGIDFEDEHSDKQFWFPQADAILAAGFRLRAQTEPTDDEMIEAYNEAVRESMARVKERDGHASSGSRESIVAGLRAVAGSRRPVRAEPTNDEREALAHAIRKGSGASRYQSILLADQILPHLDGFRRHTQAEPTDAQVAAYQAEAWTKGHAAGRDYQGDGWNSDAHDPELDNPYRSKSNGSE